MSTKKNSNMKLRPLEIGDDAFFYQYNHFSGLDFQIKPIKEELEQSSSK